MMIDLYREWELQYKKGFMYEIIYEKLQSKTVLGRGQDCYYTPGYEELALPRWGGALCSHQQDGSIPCM